MSHAARKSIVANVPIADFYATVVDYLAYPQITDEVKSARIVSREGNVAIVTFTAKVLLKGFDYTVRMVEDPINYGMAWTIVSSSTLSQNRGSWQLEALSETQTRVTYENELGAKLWIPNSFINTLSAVVLPKVLRRWSEYAERQTRRAGEAVARREQPEVRSRASRVA